MQLHEIRPQHKPRQAKRIGRGGKRGFTAGRGSKGQKARAGRRLQPIVRIWIKRYPKLRGYRQKLKAQSSKLKTAILNLDVLEKKFEAGETISPQVLLEKGLVSRIKGRMPLVKILGGGEITKSFNVEGCRLSGQAKDKIKKANGTVKISNF